MAAKKKEPSFEEAVDRLEAIVAKLEDGDVSLDESIRLFQEGREIGKRCQSQLAAVEKKAKLLLEDDDGQVSDQPFETEDEGDES